MLMSCPLQVTRLSAHSTFIWTTYELCGILAHLLRFESSSQLEHLVLLPDLDVVDLVLVEDHQGEGLVGMLPDTVPHQVRPVLNR